MKVAISTEDSRNITQNHFGEGAKFLIYKIDGNKAKFIEERRNNSPEEQEHGSREKANAISTILKDVPVLVGFQFGPNIIRIKERFLPVLSREKSITETLALIQEHWHILEKEAKNLDGKVIILSKNGIRTVKITPKNAKDF